MYIDAQLEEPCTRGRDLALCQVVRAASNYLQCQAFHRHPVDLRHPLLQAARSALSLPDEVDTDTPLEGGDPDDHAQRFDARWQAFKDKRAAGVL